MQSRSRSPLEARTKEADSEQRSSGKDEICLLHLFLSDEEHVSCRFRENKQYFKIRTFENRAPSTNGNGSAQEF